MNIREEARKMKETAPILAVATDEQRCRALQAVADMLQAHAEEIFDQNRKDLEAAEQQQLPASIQKRLRFDGHKLQDVLGGIRQLMALPDPLNERTLYRELDEGLTLCRVTCPIGVIGVIFEARPDAMVQIASLCIKSGNCAILKGGKETKNTNRILFSLIRQAVVEAGLPASCLLQAELHNEIDELLSCHGDVDLLIPRGSNAFVQYIMNNTKIPVMGHADGICHTYVDREADQEKAISIIVDAKTQYTAACNATETLLVDRPAAKEFLPKLVPVLAREGVALRVTNDVAGILGETGAVDGGRLCGNNAEEPPQAGAAAQQKAEGVSCEIIAEDAFDKEYLDLILAVKLVDGVDEAIAHINRFGSHHTDAILTENAQTAEHFMQMVDSAGVYQNCSTRFADGFRYGFGAEVGISTGKLHARGPVGLEGLVTYKYKLYGHGQIVGDYASGKASFHFRDL